MKSASEESWTQIFYLVIPPHEKLGNKTSKAGQQWSHVLDVLETSPGYQRLYWGRRLEEPENVQLHVGQFIAPSSALEARDIVEIWITRTNSPSSPRHSATTPRLPRLQDLQVRNSPRIRVPDLSQHLTSIISNTELAGLSRTPRNLPQDASSTATPHLHASRPAAQLRSAPRSLSRRTAPHAHRHSGLRRHDRCLERGRVALMDSRCASCRWLSLHWRRPNPGGDRGSSRQSGDGFSGVCWVGEREAS